MTAHCTHQLQLFVTDAKLVPCRCCCHTHTHTSPPVTTPTWPKGMPGFAVLTRSLLALLKNIKAARAFLGALGSFFLRGFFSFLAGAPVFFEWVLTQQQQQQERHQHQYSHHVCVFCPHRCCGLGC